MDAAELEDDLDDDMNSEGSSEDDPMREEEEESLSGDESIQTAVSPTLKYTIKRRDIQTKIDNGEQIGYGDFIELVS